MQGGTVRSGRPAEGAPAAWRGTGLATLEQATRLPLAYHYHFLSMLWIIRKHGEEAEAM